MSYRDGVVYDRNASFTPAELGQVTADEVCRYFNFKAYGTPTPTDDDRPTEARANTLEYWKKALSSFMPNRNHQWDELQNRGNPTKSQALNDLIRKVKRFEVRGQGLS